MNASKDTENTLRISFADILIALSILAFGVYLLMMQDHAGGSDKTVIIYKSDAIILETPLDRDQMIDLESFGVSMIIEIKDQKVRVVSSSCPHQICVSKGFTGRVHDPVICVPNHVMIEISGKDYEYDAISH